MQILQELYVNAVRKPNGLSHEDALAMVEEIAGSRPVIPSLMIFRSCGSIAALEKIRD